MFRGKYYSSLNNMNAEAIAIRAKVPEFACGADENDLMAFYAVGYDEDDAPCGTGRLYIDEDSCFRIDYLGVLPERRGKYMGDLLARMLLYKVQELNAARVKATVPRSLVYFFARYGFTASDFSQDLVDMSVDADKIRLEGSCSKGNGEGCKGNCENCG